jgi:hypothetical protein
MFTPSVTQTYIQIHIILPRHSSTVLKTCTSFMFDYVVIMINSNAIYKSQSPITLRKITIKITAVTQCHWQKQDNFTPGCIRAKKFLHDVRDGRLSLFLCFSLNYFNVFHKFIRTLRSLEVVPTLQGVIYPFIY